MARGHFGVMALLTGAALWTQVVLIPMLVGPNRGPGVAAVGIVVAALGIVALGAAFAIAAARPDMATLLALAVFPATLGTYGLVVAGGTAVRFDVPARMIAAATGIAYAVTALLSAQALRLEATATFVPLEQREPRAPAPPYRRGATLLVACLGMFLAVVAPSLVVMRSTTTRADRIAGPTLVHAREAITAAGGLALALLVVLGAGSSLLRGRAARRRRATRAATYLVWGVACFLLRMLLDLQR